MRKSDEKIVGVTTEEYTFYDSGKGWRLTQDVLNLIASLR